MSEIQSNQLNELRGNRVTLAGEYMRDQNLTIDLPLPEPHIQLSVAIPAHNEEVVILRTLEAFNRQSNRNFEVIIVDNNSQDATSAVVEQFSQTANYPLYVIKESKQGAGNARRRGMDQAAIRQSYNRGVSFIAGTDADSMPTDTWINDIIQAFKTTGVDLLAGNIHYYHFLNYPNLAELSYLDKVREATSKFIEPRIRGINFAISVESYIKIGGIIQPYTPEGKPKPGEESSLIEGVLKLGQPYAYMDSLVYSDPRRFLENLLEGQNANYSLYGRGEATSVSKSTNIDELLTQVTEADVSAFIERQLKNIFRKNIVRLYYSNARRNIYWPNARKLLGDNAALFEQDIASKKKLDYLWDTYGTEFKRNIKNLVESNGSI
jgi:glycosyltransferase involved in cell wall biosynthesis